MLVLNPNHRDTRSEAHVVEAWDECVAPAAAQHVIMVAHSYGGVCLGSLLEARRDAITARLRGCALTDSVHGRSVERLPAAQREFWVQHCVNWVTSREPLDTPVRAAVHKPPKTDGGDTDRSDSDAGGSLSDDSDDSEKEEEEAPQRCVCMLPMRLRIIMLRRSCAQKAQGEVAVGAALVRLGARFRGPPGARVDQRGLPPERVRVSASQAAGRGLGAAERSRVTTKAQCLPVKPPASQSTFFLGFSATSHKNVTTLPSCAGARGRQLKRTGRAMSRERTASPASDPALCVKARAVYARYANTPAGASAPQRRTREATSERARVRCSAAAWPAPVNASGMSRPRCTAAMYLRASLSAADASGSARCNAQAEAGLSLLGRLLLPIGRRGEVAEEQHRGAEADGERHERRWARDRHALVEAEQACADQRAAVAVHQPRHRHCGRSGAHGCVVTSAGGAASRGGSADVAAQTGLAFLARIGGWVAMEMLVPLPLLADAARCVGFRLTGDADAQRGFG